MNLQIARSLFFIGSLAVTTMAAAAWNEPGPEVLKAEQGQGACALPRATKAGAEDVSRAGHNALLFLFGLTQGLRSGA
ncbi:hypothetical protein [Pseudomonas massiliensis]|uniref:hypothetical protein n=1 Tax=Pseudomonas massiliensis TaxID=522492 RepID=UPI0005912F0F|nr:hypothetical protein [Pseudomonas massiliensis]